MAASSTTAPIVSNTLDMFDDSISQGKVFAFLPMKRANLCSICFLFSFDFGSIGGKG